MKTLLFILSIMACCFVVFRLIIIPYDNYASREYSKILRKDHLKQYCEHHEVKEPQFEDDFNGPGCRRFLIAFFCIALLVLSYFIF